MTKNVYLDFAATTFTHPQVLEAMLPYFTESFGNPSSIYSFSDRNRAAIQKAREQAAAVLNCAPAEIFFTSSGTEADNWALQGVAWSHENKGRRIITTKIEHHAVLHTGQFLAERGFDVVYLDVDAEGKISLDQLKKAMTKETILVSVMFANNEIGTIQPIAEIGELCRERGVIFHTDAVQAAAHVPIDVQAMKIDMLSMSAHKFYGPKGVGVLYIRKGTKIGNFMHGGAQEKGRRASTENVAGIVGLGAAIERTASHMNEEGKRVAALRDRLIAGVMTRIPHAKLNGAPGSGRLPNNANFSLIGLEGETMLMDLNAAGISASTGSACSSGSLDPSHVLMAIGLSHELAHGSLRLTLGETTTQEDIDYVLDTLVKSVARRREMSPLWEDYLAGLKKA